MRRPLGFLPALATLPLSAACSGEPDAPFCGDGVQDPNEACDDGNRDSGDACTPDCRIPGTVLECVPLMPEGRRGDEVNSLLALPDLSFVAAGAVDDKGWIGRYDDSGAQIWLTWPAPADEDGSNSVVDVAADGSDGYWALVRGADEALIHLDAVGHVDMRLFLPDFVQPAGLSMSPARLLVVEEQVWLVGRGAGPNLWVGKFDPATQVLSNVVSDDYAGFSDDIWAIARSESEVAVAATVGTSPDFDVDVFLTPHSNVLLIRFDLQGQEVGRHLLGAAEPEIATVAYSIAADGKGGWFVGGDQHPTKGIFTGSSSQTAWIARIHPSEGWMWTWTSPGPPAGGMTVNDIIVSDRELVVVGEGYSGPWGYWSMGLGFDGAVHWEQSYREPNFELAKVTSVASESSGRLRTTNMAWDWTPGGTSILKSCLVAW